MKTNNGSAFEYRLFRGVLLLLAAGAFWLPFASAGVTLPYFERVYSFGIRGLKAFIGVGSPVRLSDLLHTGVYQLQTYAAAGIAALALLCAVGVLMMLFLYCASFAKPEPAVKGLRITAIAALTADLLCIALGGILWTQTKNSAILSFTPGLGAAALAVLLLLMAVCDTVFLKRESKNAAARPALAKILSVVLCAAVVCGGVVCGFRLASPTEKAPGNAPGTEETEAVYVDKLPESAEEAYSLVALKIRNVLFEKKERVEGKRSVTVNGFGGTLSDAQRNVLSRIGEAMAAGISEGFAASFIDYGEDTEGALPDITAFPAPLGYSANAVNNNAFQITMRYGAESAAALDRDETDRILNAAKASFAALVTVKEAAMNAKEVEVFAEINETNGVINTLSFRVKYSVSLNCAFSGELRGLGEQIVVFELTDNVNYRISREGIYFSENVYRMAPGETMELNASLNLPLDFSETDYSITYISSNETQLTVDENGVMRALSASERPVTVTALLEFTNATGVFYDYCEIYISE